MRRSWTSHWLNDVLPAIMLSLPLSLPLHRSDDERCEEIKRLLAENPWKIGGESGIRTHGRVSPTHAFQACSFNHSDISPLKWNQQFTGRRQALQKQTVRA